MGIEKRCSVMEEGNTVRLCNVSGIPSFLKNSQCSTSSSPIERVTQRQPLLGKELFVFVISTMVCTFILNHFQAL